MMIGAPWYVLAVGIGFVLLGFFVEGFGSPAKRQSSIDPRMRDQDIIKTLNTQETPSKGVSIAFLGYVLIGVSIVWRLVRYFI